MFRYLYQKITGNKSNKEQKDEIFFKRFITGYQKATNLAQDLLNKSTKEFFSIREKCKNLLDTNYKLGINHFEKGNLSDAKIRFTIITKLWPDFYEAYYQKAYILMLQNQPKKAKKVIEKMMLRKPSKIDPKFNTLINQIESSIQTQQHDE